MKKSKSKLYRCDPDKNIYCAKNNCYRNNNGEFCHKTNIKKFRMRNIFKRIREEIKWKTLIK